MYCVSNLAPDEPYTSGESMSEIVVGDQPQHIDMANILQVIAAVAADNLMQNAIVQIAPDCYRVEITDGLGNALSQPVFVGSRYAAVQKAGIWWVSFRYGQHYEGVWASAGNGDYFASRFYWWDQQSELGR